MKNNIKFELERQLLRIRNLRKHSEEIRSKIENLEEEIKKIQNSLENSFEIIYQIGRSTEWEGQPFTPERQLESDKKNQRILEEKLEFFAQEPEIQSRLKIFEKDSKESKGLKKMSF